MWSIQVVPHGLISRQKNLVWYSNTAISEQMNELKGAQPLQMAFNVPSGFVVFFSPFYTRYVSGPMLEIEEVQFIIIQIDIRTCCNRNCMCHLDLF